VPKLWTETIDSHREAVRETILDATWQLITELGLAGVTMSQIAARAGIGRATLYKYFPDVEAVLLAWHQRHLSGHLTQLAELAGRPGTPHQRLHSVLTEFAFISHHREHHGAELSALLHRGKHADHATRRLTDLIAGLLDESAAAGQARDDASPHELAAFCLHAVTAASSLPSPAAVQRLVQIILDGLRAVR